MGSHLVVSKGTDQTEGASPWTVNRDTWLTRLGQVDPDTAYIVKGCGTYGQVSLRIGPNRSWLTGGLCKRVWDCPTCAAIQARESSQQLSDVIEYLTSIESLKPEQFLFATLGMRTTIGTTMERVQCMGKALTKLVNQRWFKDCVLGYELAWDFAGSLLNPQRPWIHAHLHGLWIIRKGVELEGFKHQVFAYMKEQLGDLIGWDHPETWEQWLQPAILSPALGNYIHGHRWKASIEVAGTIMKADKQRGGYRNYFDRDPVDLAEIQPIIRAQLVRVRRGGVIPKVRRLLDSQDAIHRDINTVTGLPLPPHYRNATAAVRRAFRELANNPSIPLDLLRQLVQVPEHVTVEKWSLKVEELNGRISVAA